MTTTKTTFAALVTETVKVDAGQTKAREGLYAKWRDLGLDLGFKGFRADYDAYKARCKARKEPVNKLVREMASKIGKGLETGKLEAGMGKSALEKAIRKPRATKDAAENEPAGIRMADLPEHVKPVADRLHLILAYALTLSEGDAVILCNKLDAFREANIPTGKVVTKA